MNLRLGLAPLLVAFVVLAVVPAHAEVSSADVPAAAARALAAPRAELELPPPREANDADFAGETGLEVGLGVGSGASLALGAVLAPELSVELNLSPLLADVQGALLGAMFVGVAFDVSFLRPRVGELTPAMEILLGAALPLLVPPGWSASARGFAGLGVGAMYVLDRHVAVRALVSPTLALADEALTFFVAGQIVLVLRP